MVRLIRLVGVMWFAVTCMAASSYAGEQTLEHLRARTEILAGSSTYRADIYQPDRDDIGRVLEIRCIEQCLNQQVYREEVGDIPLSAFSITRRHIITTWSTAVAKVVRIYYIDDAGVILPVLETGTRGLPEFTVSKDYKSPVVTFENWNHPLHLKPPVFRETWRWNGKEYKMNKRCIENCWPNFFGD